MSDEQRDDDETQAAEGVEAQTVENVNGEILDTPTVNAFVVGVTISEGYTDPQTVDEPAEG